MVEYKINVLWDTEANVWVATSDDVPGLVLESESFDHLVEKLKNAVRELVELNHAIPATSLQVNTSGCLRIMQF